MFAVGALDAYFCDAYSDLVAAMASSKSRQPGIALPEWAYEIKFPLRAILEEYDYANWRWRVAARKMMERENVVSLSAIQTLFNKFFRKGHKLFRDPLDAWMTRPDATIRLFGISSADYVALNSADKHVAREAALGQFEDRFRLIFQRRHNCIHNCDRPSLTPSLAHGSYLTQGDSGRRVSRAPLRRAHQHPIPAVPGRCRLFGGNDRANRILIAASVRTVRPPPATSNAPPAASPA